MYRIKFAICILLVLSFTLLCGCGEGKLTEWFSSVKPQASVKQEPLPEQVEGTVLASVNSRIITLEDFNARIQTINSGIETSPDIPDSVKANYLIKTVEGKKNILGQMVETELFIGEAIARGLDKDPELLKAVRAIKEQILLNKLIEAEKARVAVTTKEIENYYNSYKDIFIIPEERRLSMIVVPSEQKAKEVKIALLQGGAFAALARDNSTDESAKNGGDIGFIVQKSVLPQPDKKMMFEKFEQEAFGLELNKPSAIFKGPDGYYIIEAREIKPARQRLLSEVYNDIQQGLTLKKQEEALKSLIGNLRRGANIIVYDVLLKEQDD